MRRYKAKGTPRRVHIKLTPGEFVLVVSLPPGATHVCYINRTGSIVARTYQTGVYEVQFGEELAGSFRAEDLRIVP